MLSGNEDDVIKAIVKFTRGCLQSHYFKDANGRTFVPLMLNHLLKQNGLSPAIIMTPNHFSGFSLNELVSEVKSGMQLYKESTVSNSKKTIQNLAVKDILNSPEKCQQLIDKSLSSHPLIQLAQLNEPYIRVANGKITCGGLQAWTQKSNTSPALKSILQNLYEEKVSTIKASLNSNQGENKPPVKTGEILDQITQRHTIHAEQNVAKASKPDDTRDITIKM